jgi:hypothetical protein
MLPEHAAWCDDLPDGLRGTATTAALLEIAAACLAGSIHVIPALATRSVAIALGSTRFDPQRPDLLVAGRALETISL